MDKKGYGKRIIFHSLFCGTGGWARKKLLNDVFLRSEVNKARKSWRESVPRATTWLCDLTGEPSIPESPPTPYFHGWWGDCPPTSSFWKEKRLDKRKLIKRKKEKWREFATRNLLCIFCSALVRGDVHCSALRNIPLCGMWPRIALLIRCEQGRNSLLCAFNVRIRDGFNVGTVSTKKKK